MTYMFNILTFIMNFCYLIPEISSSNLLTLLVTDIFFAYTNIHVYRILTNNLDFSLDCHSLDKNLILKFTAIRVTVRNHTENQKIINYQTQ